MPRTMLTDRVLVPRAFRLMLKTGRVYDKPEHRNTFEGILYRMRVGCPWRDVPEAFGDWSAIYRRFNLWSKKDILMQLFAELRQLADLESGIYKTAASSKRISMRQVLAQKIKKRLGKVVVVRRPKSIWQWIVAACQ